MGFDVVPDHFRYIRNPFGRDKFSYRDNIDGDAQKIYICPQTHFKEIGDIGFRQLVGMKDKEGTGQIINAKYIINNLPCIQITEMTQETKLETIISLITSFCSGFKSGQEAVDKFMALSEEQRKWAMKYASSVITSGSFIQSALKEGVGKKFDWNTKNYDMTKGDGSIVIPLVYALQYQLMNKEIGTTYYLPYDSNQLYVSNGTDGWKSVESGFGSTSSNSILGKLSNIVGTQVRLQSEPIWNGTSQASQTNIQIKLNLVNDTAEKAYNNYYFIQNIIPNNNYLQYGLLQQAPCYYDVHIHGNRRFPICQGNFAVNAKGILRKIPAPSKMAKNFDVNDFFKDGAHELRIPDVYEVELNFKSLLPDSFNDFLYFWYMKESSMTLADNANPKKAGSGLNSDKISKDIKTIIEKAPEVKDEETYKNALLDFELDKLFED